MKRILPLSKLKMFSIVALIIYFALITLTFFEGIDDFLTRIS